MDKRREHEMQAGFRQGSIGTIQSNCERQEWKQCGNSVKIVRTEKLVMTLEFAPSLVGKVDVCIHPSSKRCLIRGSR